MSMMLNILNYHDIFVVVNYNNLLFRLQVFCIQLYYNSYFFFCLYFALLIKGQLKINPKSITKNLMLITVLTSTPEGTI